MKNDNQNRKPQAPGVKAAEGNRLFTVKIGVAALRSVRVGLMELACKIAEHPELEGYLVLPDVTIRRKRLREEWESASSALRPDILRRLCIWAGKGGSFFGIPKDPDPETRRILAEKVASEQPQMGLRLARADYSFVVLELLVHQWLLGQGPMTTTWLMEAAGCSYQTVAGVLRRLDHGLVRHSDRRIELRQFPKEEWAGLVAVAEKARGTIRFADRSGQPRSWESLLRRLQRLGRKDIAVGGVVGAKHYHPLLDLVDSPRLDLSLHCPGKSADLSFVERLDPALEQTERRGDSASLVVHLVRRMDSLFRTSEEGLLWADPVECLLDLHEARLEPQAREFLNSFPAGKGQL